MILSCTSVYPRILSLSSRRPIASCWVAPVISELDLDGVSSKTIPAISAPHWRTVAKNNVGEYDVRLPHSAYTQEQLEAVSITHFKPKGFVNRSAYGTVWLLRRTYDLFTGENKQICVEKPTDSQATRWVLPMNLV